MKKGGGSEGARLVMGGNELLMCTLKKKSPCGFNILDRNICLFSIFFILVCITVEYDGCVHSLDDSTKCIGGFTGAAYGFWAAPDIIHFHNNSQTKDNQEFN